MKSYLKNTILLGLSLSYLITIVHSHPHHGGEHNEPIVFNENNEFDHADSITHECEKCLIKNNKSKVENNFEKCSKSSSILSKKPDLSIKKHSIPLSLNSRPPPVSYL